MTRRFHPLDRLMVVRVKELSFGLDRREAGASEDVKELAVNQFHPPVELLGDALVAVLQGALETVERGKQRAYQVCGGVLQELILLTLHPLAEILELGLLAQQTLMKLLLFGRHFFVGGGEVSRSLDRRGRSRVDCGRV